VQPELLFPDDEDELPSRSPAPGLRGVVLLTGALLVAVVLVGSVVGREQASPPRPSAAPTRPAPTVAAPSPIVAGPAAGPGGQLAYVSDVDCPGLCTAQLAVPEPFVAAVRTLYPRLHVLWVKTSMLRRSGPGGRSRLYYREMTARQGRANIFVRVLEAGPHDRNQTLVTRGIGDTLTEVQVRIGPRIVQVGVDTYGVVPSPTRLRTLAHDPRLLKA
jgi:hypothetical protein